MEQTVVKEHNLKAAVYAMIEEIAAAEKITRKVLGAISRDLLIYVPDSHDIDSVNRLLGVLTPMNRLAAIHYFGHFLPWEQEKDADENFIRFGKMTQGDKKVKRKLEAINEWLADEKNNIWVWSKANLDVKPKNFGMLIAKAIKKALEGDEDSKSPPLSRDQVLDAVFEGGIHIDDLLDAVERQEARIAEAQKVMQQVMPAVEKELEAA
jgi:hypothetical protein